MKGELRIGNLVTDEFYEAFRKTIIVESVNDKGINLEIENSDDYPEMQSHWIEPYYTFDKLRGIPITPEWLDKFGFEKVSEYRFQNDEFMLECMLTSKLFSFRIRISNTKSVILRYLKYVHELQNVYHSIKEEELTLKEENRKHKEEENTK